MGTNFEEYTVKSMSWEDLKKYHKRHCDDLLSCYGHGEGASGTMSNNTYLVNHGIAFDRDEAWELINKVADKWDENSYAIKIYEPSKDIEKKREQMVIKRKKLNQKLRDIESNRLIAIVDGKSKRKSCKSCGSMIATNYIYRDSCPVCDETYFIYTESQVQKIKDIIRQRDAIINDLNKPTPRPTNLNGLKWKWFVGAQCPT